MLFVLIRVLQRTKTNRIYVDTEIYYRNWLLQLWRLRSPTICRLQARGPGKLAGRRDSVRIQRPEIQDGGVGGEDTLLMPVLIWRSENPKQWCQRVKIKVLAPMDWKFTVPPHFCSIQDLSGLDETHLLIQMLISSGVTFTDTPCFTSYLGMP